MTRHLIALLAFATLLFGCTQEERNDVAPATTGEPVVTFLAAANDPTRGTAMSGTLSTDATFRVYATQIKRSGDGYAENAEETVLIGSTNPDDNDNVVSFQRVPAIGKDPYTWVWKTNGDYYWPDDTYFVTFYAVHPASVPVLNSILGSKSFDFTNTNSTDLMYATVKTHRDDSQSTTILENLGYNSAVRLQFHHALAQVVFYGKLSSQFAGWGYRVEVHGIQVCNVNSEGSFVFTGRDADMGLASAITYFAADPLVYEDYSVAMAAETTVTSQTESVRLSATDDVLLMLPQRLTKWDITTESSGSDSPSTSKSYLAIQMRIQDAEGHYVLGDNSGFATVYVPFDCGVATGWQASKRYNYTLEFGAGYYANGQARIQPIVITAAIQDWTDETPVSESIIQQQK